MVELFVKGGPLMWPLLIASVVALATVIERLAFVIIERSQRSPDLVDEMLACAEQGNLQKALSIGAQSKDYVARVLTYALQHRESSLGNAVLRAANRELKRFNRGLSTLDTIVTLAPLLGLLGTVTGMIAAFNVLGAAELDAPMAITGGIAEALIATAFGLGIAIISLIPFNFLNAKLEEARHEIEDRATQLELALMNISKSEASPRRHAA